MNLRNYIIEKLAKATPKPQAPEEIKSHAPTMAPRVIEKAISQTRRDIADWRWSKQLATSPSMPKVYLLQEIFSDIANDALLSSQMNNHREQTISAPYEMVTPEEKVDEKLTDIIREIPVVTDMLGHIWDSEWYGNSTVEHSVDKGMKKITLINRRTITPSNGRVYPDTSLNNYIEYRDVKEYGAWIIEI
ncbi:MAG: hypothetical protein ACK5JU_08040, partial [Bacteroidales bacterium]